MGANNNKQLNSHTNPNLTLEPGFVPHYTNSKPEVRICMRVVIVKYALQ